MSKSARGCGDQEQQVGVLSKCPQHFCLPGWFFDFAFSSEVTLATEPFGNYVESI